MKIYIFYFTLLTALPAFADGGTCASKECIEALKCGFKVYCSQMGVEGVEEGRNDEQCKFYNEKRDHYAELICAAEDKAHKEKKENEQPQQVAAKPKCVVKSKNTETSASRDVTEYTFENDDCDGKEAAIAAWEKDPKNASGADSELPCPKARERYGSNGEDVTIGGVNLKKYGDTYCDKDDKEVPPNQITSLCREEMQRDEQSVESKEACADVIAAEQQKVQEGKATCN